MSLKSSEINNCCWIISTVLESSFYSSSCCQACFPSIVRPMNRLWELILKIFSGSPEMKRSVFFSMHWLWMTKKKRYFFDTSYSEKEYFPGSISIQFLLSMGTILGEERASSLLCGFASAFDRHAKSFAFSFNAYSSSWSSGISVSLLFKFITNLFDPWEILTQEWVLSLFKKQIPISTPYLPCKELVATSNTGPILVFPWIHPFGCDASSCVFTTGHCIKLCEIASVFRHEILSILNNTQKSCIHTDFTQFILLWKPLNSFFM